MSGTILVAAIDFGTTYSAYAFSFKNSYERDPLQFYGHSWTDGTGALTSKTPTSVLFDKNGEFHSFGYEAENKYASLASSENHIGWKYFRRFKMILHNKSTLNLKTRLRDDQGKTMPAIKVFSAAIKYLKDHLFNRLTEASFDRTNEDVDVNREDILWVLTVPAIWSDSAKQFMSEAAIQAGIPKDQLVLSLEPEAAAIFTKTSALSSNDDNNRNAFANDAQFMMVDLGGGTVDVTVNKVDDNGKLHELYPPSGGPWGGTLVDEHIYELLENIFGRTVLETLQKESLTEFLDIRRTLELKKRQFLDEGKVNLTLPSSLFEIYQEQNETEEIVDKLKRKYADRVIKRRGKLIIDREIFYSLFKESIDKLTDNMKEIFERQEMENVNTIVLVGGYSECEILKNTVKERFSQKNVIIPFEASTAVVKGAVLFGHNRDVIDSRRSPCTYGVSIAVPFDPMIHPEEHKYRGTCEDVFKVFIPIGARIEPGTTQATHTFNTSESSAVVEIYKSISEKPAFITDAGCQKVGVIDLRMLPGRATCIDVVMKFGDTELHVEANEHGTDNRLSARFNFLR